jgi:ABC-type lipoprotein release transport system permease subunit
MSNDFVSLHGTPPGSVLAFFLGVSPGWMETMKIPFVGGRDFRAGETNPGVAIVNQTFARQYFGAESPIGQFFETVKSSGQRNRFQIVGLVRDARYQDIRERILPIAYVPFLSVDAKGTLLGKSHGTFIVRTSSQNPLTLAAVLRGEVTRTRHEFRVSTIRTQKEIDESQTVRERLLAMLALFFAVVALLLAGIGLYGVLDYSVLQRRREIGIRVAIGARASGIVRLVLMEILAVVAIGATAGVGLGLASARYIETLLFEVKPTSFAMLAVPALAIISAVTLAALPAIFRALRVDPVAMLRAE